MLGGSPKKRGSANAKKGGGLATGIKVLGMVAFAAIVFTSGLLIGTTLNAPGHSLTPGLGGMVDVGRLGGIEELVGGGQAAVATGEPATEVPPAGRKTETGGKTQAGGGLRKPPVTVPATSPLPTDDQSSLAQTDAKQGGAQANGPALQPDTWMEFDGRRRLLELSGSVDTPDMTGAAWIWLDSRDNGEMRIIMGNREGGCDAGTVHDGYTFFVNEWGTGNQQLRLEWSGINKECQTVASAAGAIPYDTWTHVAFSIAAGVPSKRIPVRAMLFINGKVIETADVPVGRHPQNTQGLVVGAMPNKELLWRGKMAYPIVLRSVVTEKQLQNVYAATTLSSFKNLVDKAQSHSRVLMALTLGGTDEVKQAELAVELGEQVTITYPLDTGDPSAAAAAGEKPGAAGGPPSEISVLNPKYGVSGYGPNSNQWLPKLMHLEASRVESEDATDAGVLARGAWDDRTPTAEERRKSDEQGRERAKQVRGAMMHIWKAYREHAWGADEVKPRTGARNENWGGMGMTLLDALDTLWIMGLLDEFRDGLGWVKEHLNFDRPKRVSVFETTIRALGGLLSAYDLSGEQVLLDQAKDLGDRLARAFESPSGVPYGQVDLRSGGSSNAGWTGSQSVLAEVGTLQLEFRYLSHATGDPKYARLVEKVIEVLHEHPVADGLYPIYVNPRTGAPSSKHVSFGALGDSFFEYLVKTWLQGGKTEPMYREMFDEAMDGLTKKLIAKTKQSGLHYVAEMSGSNLQHKMDHLVCFVPGMLALGAYYSKGTPGEKNAQRDLQNAKAIAYTCWQMYERQATGIAPEYVEFPGGGDPVVANRAPFYLLRPEAAESLFILHQITGHPVYREWGWKMFQAIDKYCKLDFGYGAYPDVRRTDKKPDDRMESFFLAETLKYLYMLQAPDHPITLERFVFNTEAHPLRKFDHWTDGDADVTENARAKLDA